MIFNRHLLAAFQAVAEQGTVGRAARVLNATQPTISRHIRTLEQQFGQPLFDRDSRGMHLTLAGADLLPHARFLLYEMAAIQDRMDAHRGLTRGAIRIGAVTSIAHGVLPAVLAIVNRRTPGLRLEVTVASEDQLDRSLADRAIDIIFATQPPREIEAVKISKREFSDRCVVFGAASHAVLNEGPVTIARLLHERWALPPPKSTPRQQFEGLIRQAGLPPPEVALETDSVGMILSLVATGALLGWFPEPLLADSLRAGRVAIVPASGLELRRTFAMYRRARGTFPASAQVFIDAFGESMLALAGRETAAS
jgi:DNA-binding transcriptional LysR family regulator